MAYQTIGRTTIIGLALLATGLAGCGGTKLIKDAEPVTVVKPLAVSDGEVITLSLDWVIVRSGPGTWARNADWDEYMLRINNRSEQRINITQVILTDSLDNELATSGKRKTLVKESKRTTKRYKGEGLKVKAGIGGAALMATGSAAYIASMGMSVAILSGSGGAAASAGAGAAVGALALAPVLLVGGVVRSVNNGKVAREIGKRQTKLPLILEPNFEQDLVFFFPLAPSPQEIEITYTDPTGEKIIQVDTREILHGLHLSSPTAQEQQNIPEEAK